MTTTKKTPEAGTIEAMEAQHEQDRQAMNTAIREAAAIIALACNAVTAGQAMFHKEGATEADHKAKAIETDTLEEAARLIFTEAYERAGGSFHQGWSSDFDHMSESVYTDDGTTTRQDVLDLMDEWDSWVD